MLLSIVKVPHTVLSTPTKPVQKIDTKLARLIADMKETLLHQKDPEGVGLAAPQVGIGSALFIMRPTKNAEINVFINPFILKIENDVEKPEKEDKNSLEGCLSIDRVWSPVSRPHKILVQYLNPEGIQKKEWFNGFDAVIIQHEIDHLHGIMFTQRALEQNRTIYREVDGEMRPIHWI